MNDEPEEVVLLNDVSFGKTRSQLGRGGLRRLHLVRIGQPVDPEKWVGAVPEQSREEARWFAWCDGELVKRYHLNLWWPCREVIDAIDESGKTVPAVVWNEETTLEDRIEAALAEFRIRVEREATVVLTPLPYGHPPIEITDGGREKWGGYKVAAVEWIPEHCVIVY